MLFGSWQRDHQFKLRWFNIKNRRSDNLLLARQASKRLSNNYFRLKAPLIFPELKKAFFKCICTTMAAGSGRRSPSSPTTADEHSCSSRIKRVKIRPESFSVFLSRLLSDVNNFRTSLLHFVQIFFIYLSTSTLTIALEVA